MEKQFTFDEIRRFKRWLDDHDIMVGYDVWNGLADGKISLGDVFTSCGTLEVLYNQFKQQRETQDEQLIFNWDDEIANNSQANSNHISTLNKIRALVNKYVGIKVMFSMLLTILIFLPASLITYALWNFCDDALFCVFSIFVSWQLSMVAAGYGFVFKIMNSEEWGESVSNISFLGLTSQFVMFLGSAVVIVLLLLLGYTFFYWLFNVGHVTMTEAFGESGFRININIIIGIFALLSILGSFVRRR